MCLGKSLVTFMLVEILGWLPTLGARNPLDFCAVFPRVLAGNPARYMSHNGGQGVFAIDKALLDLGSSTVVVYKAAAGN